MGNSEPGTYPFTAGLHPTGYTTKSWTMRQLAGLNDTKATNERFRYLLDLGETGLSCAFDLPTQHGLDADDPAATHEVGLAGMSVSTVDDLAEVFVGIPLDKVSVSFTINATAPMLLAMWIVVAEESGVSRTALRGTMQNEMLKEFLARKATVFDLDTSMRYSVDVIEYCNDQAPGVNPISISGGHVREAGASRELEVACAIADADEYLRLLRLRGRAVDEVAPSFSFIFGSTVEILAEAAKFRAARQLYATRMRERWGAANRKSQLMRVQCNTFGSSLAAQEPLNNIVRATVQALAAVLGQVQSLHVCAFDEAHRTPGPLAARVALRTQQILAEETDLCRYVDPLGGSAVIDSLTSEIYTGAADWLERIDEQGGMSAAIRSGWLEGVVEEMAFRTPGPQVGVDGESSAGEDALVRADQQAAIGSRPVARRACEAELAAVAAVATEGGNVLPPLIEAARARATIGQLRQALTPGN